MTNPTVSDVPREDPPVALRPEPTPLPMAVVCKGNCPDCPNRVRAEEASR